MNRTLVRWLLRVYPSAWRERYGQEFEDLLQAGPGGLRAVLDVLRSGLRERWSPPPQAELSMSTYSRSVLLLSKQPSAYLPMTMSIAALIVVVVGLAMFGFPPPHADEGATAHTWQLLMLFQAPVIVWFLLKWIRKAPRLAFSILGIQIVLALAAMAPVYILGL
ncbi:MAG TPA: hypothetical protein VIC29_19620 [Steroidobacteraceae bacterium]|jgi:hypothetical protein